MATDRQTWGRWKGTMNSAQSRKIMPNSAHLEDLLKPPQGLAKAEQIPATLQAGGQRFEPAILQSFYPSRVRKN